MSDSLPRVIFVNRVYWPSTEATAQLLADLASGLAARGWPVHVIATGEASTRHEGVTIHRTGAGERHGGMVSRALNYRRFSRAAANRLASLARPGDIVVTMTDPPLLGAHLAPVVRRTGARLVHWTQDIYPEIAAVHFGALAGLLLSPLRSRRDAAWRDATACVTLGPDMRTTLLGRGVAPEHVRIIPNWAPRELHQPATPDAVAERRRAWGVADKFAIVYSGNLGRVHEFATVLAAADLLRAEPGIVFVLVGRGARYDEVGAAAQARGLDNIRLLPPEPRERLAAALTAADAHLVTLRPEYGALVYPSKLAGVLAAARPALFVGPPAGDIGQLLPAERCGAAFAPGDARGLADTIRAWQADAAARQVIGTGARAAYERHFTFAAALAAWDELLRRTAGSAAPSFAQ